MRNRLNKKQSDSGGWNKILERQDRINNIALFFLFPIIYFTTNIYFVDDTPFLGVSPTIWLLSAMCYYLFFIGYHLWQQAFPYQGMRRYLAFADITYILLLTSLSSVGYLFWILLYAQISAVVVGMRFTKEFPKLFSTFYVVALLVVCLITGYWAADERLGQTILLAGIHFSGIGILIMMSWYGASFAARHFQEEGELKISVLWQKRMEEYLSYCRIIDKERQRNGSSKNGDIAKETGLCQQALFQVYRQHHQFHEKLTKQALDFQEQLFEDLQTIVFSATPQAQLARKHHEKIKLEPLLEHYFTKTQLLFHERQNPEKQSPANIDIHAMDTLPTKIYVAFPAILYWVIYQWFSYFLIHKSDKLKILLSYHNKQMHIKGIGTLNAEDTGHYPQGVTCPTCHNNVRTLYQYSFSPSGFHCSHCLKTFVEKQLKTDWESSEDSNTGNTALWLSRYLLHTYNVGTINYGIHSWDNREYAITLVINDMRSKGGEDETGRVRKSKSSRQPAT